MASFFFSAILAAMDHPFVDLLSSIIKTMTLLAIAAISAISIRDCRLLHANASAHIFSLLSSAAGYAAGVVASGFIINIVKVISVFSFLYFMSMLAS
jgi:hypothetical protein